MGAIIGAAGPTGAHYMRRLKCQRMPTATIARSRAPTVILLRINTTTAWGCFYPRSSIARGCAFHPCAIDDPRGRFLVRATSMLCNDGGRDLSRHVIAASQIPTHANSGHCALCAPTVFSGRIKSASIQKTRLWIKTKRFWGCLYTRWPIARGCAFHPCAIGDPREQLLVRAISQLRNNAVNEDSQGQRTCGYSSAACASRRLRTAAARRSSILTLSSQPMQASVMDTP